MASGELADLRWSQADETLKPPFPGFVSERLLLHDCHRNGCIRIRVQVVQIETPLGNLLHPVALKTASSQQPKLPGDAQEVREIIATAIHAIFRIKPAHAGIANDKIRRIEHIRSHEVEHLPVDPSPLQLHQIE